MDYKELAAKLIELVGGKFNVKSVVHCATRLRFTLNDDKKANTDAITKLKGILQVVNARQRWRPVPNRNRPGRSASLSGSRSTRRLRVFRSYR